MALEVVGAGFGRTGTLSLKHALERLGFGACYHMTEIRSRPDHRELWRRAQRGEPVDWDALFAGFRSAVDWPACNQWRELAEHYPESKVILSTRDPGRWFESLHETIYKFSSLARKADDPAIRAHGEWAFEIIWDEVFDGRMDDREHVTSVFRTHEEEVKATIPRERLLVFEASSGWPPLCEFLAVPVPEEPYPRTNTSEEFRSRHSRPQPEA